MKRIGIISVWLGTTTLGTACGSGDTLGGGGLPASGGSATGGMESGGTAGDATQASGARAGEPAGGHAGTLNCVTGNEHCPCYPNGTCNGSLACVSDLCIDLTSGRGGSDATGGTAGVPETGGAAGTGGNPETAGNGGNPETGGAEGTGGHPGAAGAGGNPGTGGTGGVGGNPETGGASGAPAVCTPSSTTCLDDTTQGICRPDSSGYDSVTCSVCTGEGNCCNSTSDDCGSRQCGTGTDNCGMNVTCGTCGGDETCVDESICVAANLIDDFLDCNNTIYAIGGRFGYWYSYHSSTLDPDAGIGTPPPSDWGITECATWMTGGTDTPSSKDYAGIGFTINDESPYDACSYTGVEITYGSDQPLLLRFRHGSSAGSATNVDTTLPAVSQITTTRVAFPAGVCDDLTNIEWRPTDYTGFGIAVFGISLY